MFDQDNYNQFSAFVHQPVMIQCSDGSIHLGIVESVDDTNVYLRPLRPEVPNAGRGPGGYIYPGVSSGAFWGGFAGSLLGIGLSTIIGIRPYPFGPGPYGPRPPYGPVSPFEGGYGPGYGPFY